ncbi:hypothetical protein BU23DRAFT_590943 [Bimuria novae-zelandiae CBS 107.79]|uniref:DUF1279 domain-containing protein n=1 Tax=Bimuria novae-zelandiae CBS 107.79 TaxID=1447943 RepID=A0A6A5V1Q3_9PLEO|nr:hypothetical protein BU23DRAFT_590943 [Bimuria novae-zelandiae CBS 107.79]
MASRRPLASSVLRVTLLRLPSLRASLPPFRRPFQGRFAQIQTKKSAPSRVFRRNYSKKPRGSTQANPTPKLGSPEPHSFTARLKKLSREYGWTVIGVYLALTVADLPFCFLAVKYIGAERIAYAEHVVVSGAKDLIGQAFPNLFDKENENEAEEKVVQAEKAEKAGEPTFWTKLGLVFIVHKSFIFIRVPLTAAVTPKVVKTLRNWGYNIGKRTPKTK